MGAPGAPIPVLRTGPVLVGRLSSDAGRFGHVRKRDNNTLLSSEVTCCPLWKQRLVLFGNKAVSSLETRNSLVWKQTMSCLETKHRLAW